MLCFRCGKGLKESEAHVYGGSFLCINCYDVAVFDDEMGMCGRCGVIIPKVELRILDTWMLCTFCYNDTIIERREMAEKEKKKERGICPRCGKPSHHLRALPTGEIVCERCYDEKTGEIPKIERAEEEREEKGLGGVMRIIREFIGIEPPKVKEELRKEVIRKAVEKEVEEKEKKERGKEERKEERLKKGRKRRKGREDEMKSSRDIFSKWKRDFERD